MTEQPKSTSVSVSVMYALPDEQRLFEVRVPEGSSAREAIQQSGLLDYYPEIDINTVKIGIFSELVKLEYLVQEGDRIEVYRPLIADPKELRKRRAQKAVDEGRANHKTGAKVKK